MIERLFSNIKQLVLPFSVLSKNRKEPFTEEMEKAAIFCFSELERAKGGGLILKQPPEKTAFLTEVLYPFWAIPWHESTLVFDGLNMIRRTLTYEAFADVKAFRENAEKGSRTLENYVDFLSDNISYFQIPESQKQTILNGLITDPKLQTEFTKYLSEAMQVEIAPTDLTVLPTAIDEAAISNTMEELDRLKLEYQQESNRLYESMKFLSTTTNDFVKMIRANIRAIQKEFGEEIRKVESIVTPKVDRIQEEYDEQITALTRNFERQLMPVQKEKMKSEKTREQKQYKIERCKADARRFASREDKVGERKCKEGVKKLQKELSELQPKIKELQEKLNEIEGNKSAETLKLRSEKETKITEAKKELLELQASLDAKVQALDQEMDRLKELTSAIITQIDNAAKLRESNLAELEKFGLQQEQGGPSLVYLPFYLVCYQLDSRRRYEIVPPSLANSVSLSVKLKGALGSAKIKNILGPRFKNISGFLKELPFLIEQNAVLKRELDEAGTNTNILRADMQEQIGNGLKSLNEEGWFSEKEYQAFRQVLG